MTTQNTSVTNTADSPADGPTADWPNGNQGPSRRCRPRGCGAGPHPGGPHTGPDLAASWARRRVPVNIEDTPTAYILSLYASGLDKSAIHVSTQADLLSIRYEPRQTEDNALRFTLRERAHRGFERSFGLNAKVRTDDITAMYRDGVLTVQLPKTHTGGA